MADVIVVFYFGQFLASLLPYCPKNENVKTNKKSIEISSFNTSVPKK